MVTVTETSPSIPLNVEDENVLLNVVAEKLVLDVAIVPLADEK